MKESHLCDPELFRKVKEAVTMHQVAEYYGFHPDRRGLCLCPFHKDQKPSLKIYPDGKGFYCFSCGTGGDQIKFAALYRDVGNTAAAKELAEAFGVSLSVPMTYREKREAAIAARQRKLITAFSRHSGLYVKMYRILLCEALHERNRHFEEALENLTYTEHLLECIEQCPEEVYRDKKAVKKIGDIERRIADWHIRIEADGSVSR